MTIENHRSDCCIPNRLASLLAARVISPRTCAADRQYRFGKNQMSNYTLFEKTKPIFACFGPKTAIRTKNKANSKPIQSQNEPISDTNGLDTKRNVCLLLTEYYGIL